MGSYRQKVGVGSKKAARPGPLNAHEPAYDWCKEDGGGCGETAATEQERKALANSWRSRDSIEASFCNSATNIGKFRYDQI